MHHFKLLLLPFLALLLSSCMKLSMTQEEGIVAKVNGEVISTSDFYLTFNQLKSDRDQISQQNSKIIEQLKSRALNESIIGVLLRQEAQRNKIIVAREEIESRLSSWKDSYPPGEFNEMLRKQNLTEEYLKQRINQQVLIEKLINTLFRTETLIPNDELETYFKAHQKEFRQPAKIRAFQIVVSTKEEASKIRQEIISKRLSFQSAARKYSRSPDASRGGDLGFYSYDEKIPAFNQAFSLSIGEVSSPIESKYGVHLLMVTEKLLAKNLTFSQAKAEVNRVLKRQKEMEIYKDWMTTLLREGKIFRNEAVYLSIS